MPFRITFVSGRSQDFFLGGPSGTFSSPLREPTAFSGKGGGGVVAEIFRDLDYRIGFSGWGGGVVAEIVRDLSITGSDSVGGGGVVAEIFRGLNYRIGFSGGGGGSSRKFSRWQVNHIPSIFGTFSAHLRDTSHVCLHIQTT